MCHHGLLHFFVCEIVLNKNIFTFCLCSNFSFNRTGQKAAVRISRDTEENLCYTTRIFTVFCDLPCSKNCFVREYYILFCVFAIPKRE